MCTNDNFSLIARAAGWRCAALPGHLGMRLGLLRANALCVDAASQKAACNGELAEHDADNIRKD